MRYYIIFLLFIFLTKTSVSQQIYGNEWIKPNLTYFKINTTADGVYKISYNQIVSKFGDLTTLNPKFLRLYKNGKEQAIFVDGEADGKFDPSDFILFYGEKNDGKLDQILYEKVSFQPNIYTSLYTDTSAYFLTVDNILGKRLNISDESSAGLGSVSSINVSSIHSFASTYYGGAYVLAQTSESEYTEGEGLAGGLIGKGQSIVENVNTQNHVAGTNFTVSFGLIGRSNASYSNQLGHNHHYQIEISNNGNSYTPISDSTFKSYAFVKKNKVIGGLNLTNISQIRYTIPDDLNAVTDYQAPAFYRIDYQRNLDIQGVNSLKFTGSYSQNSLLRFTNGTLSIPFLIDFRNNLMVRGNKNGNNIDFVLKPSIENEFVLFDQSAAAEAILEIAKFPKINPPVNNDFIIIANKALTSGALAYQNYRTESGYKPLVVFTDEIFNEFYYGINHPLAIRNFVQYLQNTSPNVKYILLLGKGISNYAIKSTAGAAANLVHTIGIPPSDNMFSAPLYGPNLAPQLAISRLPATTNQHILDYLDKLKTYESKPDDVSRKEIIHISGGSNLSDNLSWAAYQEGFGSFAKQEFFGAKLTSFKKNVSLPIETNLQEKIIKEINKGTNFLSFLGHGSAFVTEINFGEPKDLAPNSLLNYMINGCLAGNPNSLSFTIGEKYLFEPNKGAVGWVATSDEGVASYLSGFSRVFYKNSFNANYGASIAANIAKSIKEYQNPSDILNRMHCRQFNLQGDPALQFYAPKKPDFYADQNAIFIKTEKPTTALDSLTLGIIIKNKGKALNDSLQISLKRTFKDNSVETYGTWRIKPVFNTDTLFFTIETGGKRAEGDNIFTLTLDADNRFDESDELNNVNSTTLFIPGNGVNLLYPKAFAIVSKPHDVELVVQSSDLFTINKNYIFEIDTVKDFSSAWKKTQTVTANALAKTSVSLLQYQVRTYYWRSKLDLPSGDGGDWQYSSFTYQPTVEEGFSQKGDGDAFTNEFKSINFNSTNQRFEFDKTTHLVTLSTRGDDAPTTIERTFRSSIVGRLAFAGYDFQAFTLVAIHPLNSTFFSYPSVNNFQNDTTAYTGQYFFDLKNSTDVDSLVNYINKIPDGYKVVGFNGRNVDLQGMPQRAKDAFAKLGCLTINNVPAGEPYLFFGEKGSPPGSAQEVIADYSSDIPPLSQTLLVAKEYNPFFNKGYYSSRKVGPAKIWSKAYFDFNKEPEDELTYQIIGVTQNNAEVILLSNITQDEVSLSSINAQEYPFIKLRALATDNVKRTPPQLNRWTVAYEDISENSIDLDLANIYHANEIQEGDSIRWKVGYKNISKHQSDSVKVYATITTPQRTEIKTLVDRLKPLAPNEEATIDFKKLTTGLSGKNSLRLDFETNPDNDSYSFNNQIRKDFTVLKDSKVPMIDLTFDGKHIINREIVSPSPNISIFLRDENPFLLLNDTTVMEVSLKREEDVSFKRIYYRDGKLIFTPSSSGSENSANISYKPEKLEDGIYVLKLRSKDKSGNYYSEADMEVSFEVINKSTITNFYPYPNPVVNSMRFVFTLTGEFIPEKIKIQISTMTGKVVREVLKEELGQLRIGDNVSEFTWDGTDQFGDRLANGVYFYKVFVESGDTEMKHRRTIGDKYFKNQIGKIYLLR